MQSGFTKKKILIVDDTPENIDVLVGILSHDYQLITARDGEKALRLAESKQPDLVLLDVMMPGIDGYEVCQRLKSNETTKEIPVIFITAKSEDEDETHGFEIGAVDYIIKPVSLPIVRSRVRTHLQLKEAQEELKKQNEVLEEKVLVRTKELALTQDLAIFCMATVAEFRDPETGAHIMRTQNYVRALAEQVRKQEKYRELLDKATIELLYKSAPLHDIGKVGITDDVLLKPGKLTKEEFQEIKKHTTYGQQAISKAEKTLGSTTSFLHIAKEIANSHHEKWDGTGYPDGLAGEKIPLSARLMALADVYDALISDRVYKAAFSHEKATSIIIEGKGKHFDPDVVEAFLEQVDVFQKIALEYGD